jgi:hypothetical protein
MDKFFLDYNSLSSHAVEDTIALPREDPRFFQMMNMRITTHRTILLALGMEHRLKNDEMIQEKLLPILRKLPRNTGSRYPMDKHRYGCTSKISSTYSQTGSSVSKNIIKRSRKRMREVQLKVPQGSGLHAGALTIPTEDYAKICTLGDRTLSSIQWKKLSRSCTCRQQAPVEGANT